jgi:hypothetical protein
MFEATLIEDRQAAEAQGLPTRQGRTRRRIGILSFSSPGHYYPISALGRRLQSRGHEVIYFQVADLERPIRAAGLQFCRIGREDFPLGALRARDEELGQLEGLAALRCGLRGIEQKAMMLFRDAPVAIRDAGVDSLIVDQIEMAGGTVAEHLGLPFVSVAAALPINRLGSGIGRATWLATGSSRGSYRRSTDSAGSGGYPPHGTSMSFSPDWPRCRNCPPPWNCRAVACRPTFTTPARGRTRRGVRRWIFPGRASTLIGPWCMPRWARFRTEFCGRFG